MIEELKNQKILFFCAHPDDDVFSSGALISHLANNNHITCVYLTSSPRGVARDISTEEKIKIRKLESINSCRILGSDPLFLDLGQPILECNKENISIVLGVLQKEDPDIVFLPPLNDAHPTHRTVNEIVLKVLESFKVNEAWYYETWTPLAVPGYVFFFNDDLMKVKIEAMKQYESQLERLDYISSTVAFNIFRGIMGQELMGGFGRSYKGEAKYGEAFQKVINKID